MKILFLQSVFANIAKIGKVNDMAIVEREMTFAEYASILGIDDFETPCEYDLTDVGTMIEGPNGFRLMTNFVVKESVETAYLLGQLKGTSEHRTLVNGEWVPLKDNPSTQIIDGSMQVVDVSVPDGNAYIANGHINHNTTPGGEWLASHARV